MNKVRILSIDGGGIRGIIPATILNEIEKKIQLKTGNKNSKLADYVDFVAGTSTGGILACALLTPSKESPSKARYSAKEILEMFHKYGTAIFKKNLSHQLKTLWGLIDEKYSKYTFERSMASIFNNTMLSQLLKPCLITAYEISNRKAMFFTQHNAQKTKAKDFFVRDVAEASAAAPTYFEASEISSALDVSYPLIDGGVFANNPAMCAYAEVRKLAFEYVNQPTSSNMFMLSLGTGEVQNPLLFSEVKSYGLAQWIKPLISIMMSGNAETVSYQLKWIFDAGKNAKSYIRIQPSLHNASSEIDNVSKKNIEALTEAAELFISENNDLLENIVSQLVPIEDTLS
ncbi:patatin-like phospholipase family protein [Echinicola sp. CAU 1574]|uniref:Patatin-like phospholipase family protein n=1 Tax=Echinicola arenosa TaxID=2774144 RepID=A0ABR9AHG0_9BACT|nr:patatin-like phospholipase family protein [Echinicola arenosa]MBD8487385.1 patatin-like phospholipase family protein [Echinicola arenosa]